MDSEITKLQREQAKYRKVYGSFSRAPPEICKEYKQFHRKISSLQKQRDRVLKVEFQQDYFNRIHNEELKKQLKKVIEFLVASTRLVI